VVKIKDMNIREWYMNEFPADDLGFEINTEATFGGLYWVLQSFSDVYLYLGVVDSLVRERCFYKLSTVDGVTYDDVYSKWLASNE
jgi:hypothetical protein